MRLSWLAQLFTRGRSRAPAAEPSAAGGPRFRAEPPAAKRTTGPVPIIPSRPRISASPTPLGAAARRPAPASGAAAAAPQGSVTIEAPAAPVAPRSAAPRDDEIVRTTKMPANEELAIKMNEGLKGLSTLLSSIDERLVQQQRASELVAERLQTLPRVLESLVETERGSLQTLRDLNASLGEQGRASLRACDELGKLPALVDTIGSRIDQQTSASASMRTSVESVGQSVRGLVDVAQRGQNSLITEFRRGQDDQRHRLETLVDRQRQMLWIVAGLGVVVVVCLLIVLTRLPR